MEVHRATRQEGIIWQARRVQLPCTVCSKEHSLGSSCLLNSSSVHEVQQSLSSLQLASCHLNRAQCSWPLTSNLQTPWRRNQQGPMQQSRAVDQAATFQIQI